MFSKHTKSIKLLWKNYFSAELMSAQIDFGRLRLKIYFFIEGNDR